MNDESTPLTELEVLEADLLSFNIAPARYKTQRAYECIKSYFKQGEPIPNELESYLINACDYQLSNLGNTVTNALTMDRWESRVIDVEMLRRCGYTVKTAIEAIVERDGSVYAESSLKVKRKEHKDVREKRFIDVSIYEAIKLYGAIENDLEKIILTIK